MNVVGSKRNRLFDQISGTQILVLGPVIVVTPEESLTLFCDGLHEVTFAEKIDTMSRNKQ